MLTQLHLEIETPGTVSPQLSFTGGIGLMALSQLLAAALIIPAVLYSIATKHPKTWWALSLAMCIGVAAGMLVTARMAMKGWNLRPAALFTSRRPVLPDLPWVATAVIGYLMAMMAGATYLGQRWTWFGEALDKVKPPLEGPAWVILPYFIVVGPVVEEILFRGVILRGMLGRYRAGTAVFASAAVFALPHMYLVKLPIVLLVGTGLGWLYLRSGSLWLPIAAHIINNGIGSIAQLVGGPPRPPALPLWQMAALATAGCLLVWFAYRRLAASMDEIPQPTEAPQSGPRFT